MNVFDIGIVLVIIMFGIVGAKRGLIKEAASLIGVLVTFVLAFMLKGPIGNLLCKFLPVIDFGSDLQGLSALSILAYHLIAFLIMFIIILLIVGIVMKISKFIQKIVNMTIVLILPSAIGGFIVGMLSGYFIVFIVLINLNMFLQGSDVFTESKVSNYMIYDTPVLSATCRTYSTTVYEVYKLGNDIKNDKISTLEANSIAIDEMLKTKIISKEAIIDLINVGKVENSSYLQNVLNKY